MYIGNLDPVSNREDWTGTIGATDLDNLPVDITGASIDFEVRDRTTKVQSLAASVGHGITITNGTDGIFEWSFTALQMGGLCPMTYEVGITLTLNGGITQLFIGTVPVLDGIVT